MMENEWYYWAYKNKPYLRNKALYAKRILNSSIEHAHCEVCWAKFSSQMQDLQNGYYEKESHSWICDNCYKDLRELFGWSEVRRTDLLLKVKPEIDKK